MKERELWRKLRDELKDTWMLDRIESGVSPGFPDVIAIYRKTGKVCFIELKTWKGANVIPKYGALHTSQREWHMRATKANANNYLLGVTKRDVYYIGQPDGMNFIEWIHLHELKDVEEILLKGVNYV